MRKFLFLVIISLLTAAFAGCVNNPYNEPGTITDENGNNADSTSYVQDNDANDAVNWANDGVAYNRATEQ